MSLIEVKVEPELLKRLLSFFERIADSLDRAYPPFSQVHQHKPYGPEAITEFDSEAAWLAEAEEERLREQGLTP